MCGRRLLTIGQWRRRRRRYRCRRSRLPVRLCALGAQNVRGRCELSRVRSIVFVRAREKTRNR